MVRTRLEWALLPVMMVLLPALPVRADSVLEQMQNEIAALAKHTKSAVVSVEDERVLTSSETDQKAFARAKQEMEAANRQQKQALEAGIAGLKAAQDALDKQRDSLREKYTAEYPAVKEVESQRNAIRKQMEDSRRKLQDWRAANPPLGYFTTDMRLKSGTGFSIGDGYVVTTADVLDGMSSPIVVTDGGTRIKAKVVGVNSNLNIGLLLLLGKSDVGTLKLGDSSAVTVGHFAVSVGNQSGQANSVALMLVGGLRSEGTYSGNHFYPRLIQFAGTVGAGTSGAPLVNVRGEVIGMMAAVPGSSWTPRAADLGDILGQAFKGSADSQKKALDEQALKGYFEGQKKSSDTRPGNDNVPVPPVPPVNPKVKIPVLGDLPVIGQSFQSQPFWQSSPVTSAGFAIPINDIKPVIEELRKGTPLVQGWIGISPKEDSRVSEQDGIVHVERTVRIEGIFPDSPAFRAGMQPGDILVSLNERPVQSAAEVREVSVGLRPGDKIAVVVKHGDETRRFELTIAARPPVIKPPITTPIKESL